MTYAPVIIPTLNRAGHLRRCLESLEKNTIAGETEVYISVDYPPNDKYAEGYQRIVEYLKQKKENNAFKGLHVYFQDNNLGSSGNTYFLKGKVREKYESYIFTEDDNEFSVNFLEYVNKGLELFEEDKRIVAISGYNACGYKCGNSNVALIKCYPAYGIGSWFSKEEELFKAVQSLLSPELTGNRFFGKLRKEDRTLFNHYILSILLGDKKPFWENGKLRLIDSVISIWLHYAEQYTVIPDKGKSRTHGNDGSGENMRKNLDLSHTNDYQLDDDSSFLYVINGEKTSENNDDMISRLVYDKVNDILENRFMKAERTFAQNCKADLAWTLLKASGYDLVKTKRKIERMRSFLRKR